MQADALPEFAPPPVKKQRTAKQIEATKFMQNRRKEALEHSLLNASVDQRVDEKLKRRREKHADMERLFDERMERYHGKLLEELRKPVGEFLGRLEREDAEEEETKQAKATPRQVDPIAAEHDRNQEVREKQRASAERTRYSGNIGSLRAPNPRERFDFSR